MGKFERFLTGFTSIKANYQVYDRGDWPLSLGYFIIYRLLTKLENVSDHVRFFPEVGGGGGKHDSFPHLASPLSQRRSVSSFFWLSLVFVKSTNPPTHTKNGRTLLSLWSSYFYLRLNFAWHKFPSNGPKSSTWINGGLIAATCSSWRLKLLRLLSTAGKKVVAETT